MKNEKMLSTREVAELTGVCKQRIFHKITQGHYKGVCKCECGQTVMIPASEVTKDMLIGKRKRGKDNQANL